MQGQIDWHVLREIRRIDYPYVEAKRISSSIKQILPACHVSMHFSCQHVFWHARWDTTIVTAAYNNNDILMVPYEDLPDGDKDVISKAIEEFQKSICCPTPRHVTIQLFRNIHYQEFCCMGRQMQMKLKIGVSSWKL